MAHNEHTNLTVIVIGGLLVDDIAIGAENIRPQSSNPVRWRHRLGGVATNVARVAAQQLNVLLIANIGDDANGNKLSALLENEAIPTSLVEWAAEPSDRYTAVLHASGELFVGLADAKLIERMSWSDIRSRLPATQPAAVVLDANLSHACLTESLNALDSHYNSRVPVYALAVSPTKAIRWLGLANLVDVLFCNRREAAALSGHAIESDINTLADALSGVGFQRFVITDASSPIVVQEEATRTQITLDEVRITHNVNGAGDALSGATISQIVQGKTLSQAVQASLCAANAVLTGDAVSPSL